MSIQKKDPYHRDARLKVPKSLHLKSLDMNLYINFYVNELRKWAAATNSFSMHHFSIWATDSYHDVFESTPNLLFLIWALILFSNFPLVITHWNVFQWTDLLTDLGWDSDTSWSTSKKPEQTALCGWWAAFRGKCRFREYIQPARYNIKSGMELWHQNCFCFL